MNEIPQKRRVPKTVFRVSLLIVAALLLLIAINYLVLPLFGYVLGYENGQLRFVEVISYSHNESLILKVLIEDTPTLNKIPQIPYLKSKTGLDDDRIRHSLSSLADFGDIVLNDSGIIVDAYPWTSRSRGIQIYMGINDSTAAAPLLAAGALYAMSIFRLYNRSGEIEARLWDTREDLTIGIKNNEIVFVNKIAAVVYRADTFENSRFFASPDGAEHYYKENFENGRLIRLDRALQIGNIIAENIKGKIKK